MKLQHQLLNYQIEAFEKKISEKIKIARVWRMSVDVRFLTSAHSKGETFVVWYEKWEKNV